MAKQRRVGCAVKGCDGKHRAHGYCNRHYQQTVRCGEIINTSKGKHMGAEEIAFEVEEDKPVEVKAKPRRLHLTPAQLVCSSSDVFWRWNRENPIGWPRVETSRLVVGK